jgi:hypothetical protein
LPGKSVHAVTRERDRDAEQHTSTESRNQGSGFVRTIRAHAEPEEAWALAMRSISNATGRSDEAVRGFLDSRYVYGPGM